MGIFHRAKQSEKSDKDILKQYVEAYSEYRDERLFRTFQRNFLSYSQQDALNIVMKQRIADYQKNLESQSSTNLKEILKQETNPIRQTAIEQLLKARLEE